MAADAKATFTVALEDETSGAATSAAKALQQLREQIDGDTRALAEMQKAMKNLQSGNVVNIQQFKELKAKIDAKKQAIATAQSSYISLGGTFGKTRSSGQGMSAVLQQLKEQAQGMPGPLSGVARGLGSIKLASGLAVLGTVAVTAALVALTAATVAAVAALAKYGVAQADARRSELLRLEGMTKMRNWYGIAAGNAVEIQKAVDRVSASVSISRDKVAQYAQQLYQAHLRGENLSLALEGVAIKAATQGEAAASNFAGWAAGAAMAGGSVRRLTDDVKARLGGIAQKQMLALTTQSEKSREAFGMLFADLRIEGLLKSLRGVTELFSQSTASGRALKAILTSVVQPVVDMVEAAGPLVRRFFQGMILAALDLQIAYFRLKIRFKETFGDVSLFKGMDGMRTALKLGELAVYGLAGGLFVAAAALTALLTPFALIAGAVYIVGRGFYELGKSVGEWAGLLFVLAQKALALDWASLGRSIVDGIVNGLKSGASFVVEAMRSLGDTAWKAFKDKLGIASPSKEFAKLGRALPEGVQQGVESGTPGARAAVEDMVSPRDVRAPAPAARAGSAKVEVNVGDIHVHTQSTEAKGIAQDIRAEMIRVFESLAIQMGADKKLAGVG